MSDGHPIFADRNRAGRGMAIRCRNEPLLNRDAAFHPEAEAIFAVDLVHGHGSLRFGHRTGIFAWPDLAHLPAPFPGKLSFVLDPLDQGQSAIRADLADADRATAKRLLHDDLDRANTLGLAFEEAQRIALAGSRKGR